MDGPMAYVTFLMRGDGYLPGALTLAYALRCQETPYPLVCLVTGDVSQEFYITMFWKSVKYAAAAM